MARTMERNGWVYEANEATGQWEAVRPTGGGQGTFIPNPTAQFEAPKARADIGQSQASADSSRASAARTRVEAGITEASAGSVVEKAAADARRAQADAEKAEVEARKAVEASSNAYGISLTAEEKTKQFNRYKSLPRLSSGINEMWKLFRDNLSGTNPLEGIVGNLRPQDKVFNDASGQLTAFVADALGLSGQQFNTPAEQQLFIGSILPKASDTDEQIVTKLNRLEQMVVDGQRDGAALLNIKPESDPVLNNRNFSEIQKRISLDDTHPAYSGGLSVNAPAGVNPEHYQGNAGAGYIEAPQVGAAVEGSLQPDEKLKGLNAEVDALIRQGASNVEINNWYKKRSGDTRDLLNLDKVREFYRANPKESGFVDVENRVAMPSALSTSLGEALLSPAGTATTTGLNALTGGNLGTLAGLVGGDRDAINAGIGALRSNSPIAGFTGDLAGGIGGTLGAMSALGAGAKALGGSGRVAGLPSNPLTAEALYGASVGGNETNSVAGALVGAGLGAGGGALGNRIGRGLANRAAGPDPLTGAERRVLDAAGKAPESAAGLSGGDAVAAALTRANELGVPMTLSDTTIPLNSLTNVSLMKSTPASEMASGVYARRNADSLKRFRGALSRNLGDPENIPQRLVDLSEQAKLEAGPLYKQAYAQPGASSVDISDLSNAPAFQDAIKYARTLAGNDRVDPTTLGFDLDDMGQVVLTDVPSFQTLDYIGRGLGRAEREALGEHGVATETSSGVTRLRKDLASRVYDVNDYLRRAREAYSGPMGEADALKRGTKWMNQTPDQLGVTMQNLSPTQQEMGQMGVISALMDRAGKGSRNRNAFEVSIGGADDVDQLNAVFPNNTQGVADLVETRNLEALLRGRQQSAFGGSPTAGRGEQIKAFDDPYGATDFAIDAASTIQGAPPPAAAMKVATGLLNKVRSNASIARQEQLASEIADLTLGQDTQQAINWLADAGTRSADYDRLMAELLLSYQKPANVSMSAAAQAGWQGYNSQQ